MPILYRPEFFARYFPDSSPKDQRYISIPTETTLLLYGMFSLAARFSKSDYFESVPHKDRGKPFAAEAQSILQNGLLNSEMDSPNLAYLQGCTLVAYHSLTCGPNIQAWLLVGTCSRMAVFMGLNVVDEDMIGKERPSLPPVADWVCREERRRLFWTIWEMDSALSYRIVPSILIDDTSGYNSLPPTIAGFLPHQSHLLSCLQITSLLGRPYKAHPTRARMHGILWLIN